MPSRDRRRLDADIRMTQCGPTGPATRSPRCSTCRCSTCSGEAQQVHRAPSRAERGPALHPALDQDRRLPGGLRLLQRSRRTPKTGLKAEKLMDVRRGARRRGARRRRRARARFCMGAAWREPKDRDMDALGEMVAGVKAMGLETCMTLGMLTPEPGRPARRGGARLLQPQSRHLARILWRDHHHADLSGPARHAGACPRVGHGGLLRRHRRHGRDAARTGSASSTRSPRCPPIRRACRSTRWCRSRAPCSATCSPTRRWRRSTTSSSSAPSRWRGSLMPRSMVRLSAGRESMSESDAGALLPRRRQLDLHRRQAAHHAAMPATMPTRRCSPSSGLAPMTSDEPARAAAE